MGLNPGLKRYVVSIEPDYVVEKVLDQRINPETGAMEYLLKWQNYGPAHNTWEPEDNLNCEHLIAEFDADRARRRAAVAAATVPKRIIGFARGFEPTAILAVMKLNGRIFFIISWKDFPLSDFVPSEEANLHCPQLVIAFYEKHTVFVRNGKQDTGTNNIDDEDTRMVLKLSASLDKMKANLNKGQADNGKSKDLKGKEDGIDGKEEINISKIINNNEEEKETKGPEENKEQEKKNNMEKMKEPEEALELEVTNDPRKRKALKKTGKPEKKNKMEENQKLDKMTKLEEEGKKQNNEPEQMRELELKNGPGIISTENKKFEEFFEAEQRKTSQQNNKPDKAMIENGEPKKIIEEMKKSQEINQHGKRKALGDDNKPRKRQKIEESSSNPELEEKMRTLKVNNEPEQKDEFELMIAPGNKLQENEEPKKIIKLKEPKKEREAANKSQKNDSKQEKTKI